MTPPASSTRDPLLDRPSWAPAWLPGVDDLRRMRVFGWVLGAVFLAGLGACVLRGADAPADPSLDPDLAPVGTSATDPDAAGSDGTRSSAAALALLESFGEVAVRLISSAGDAVALCLLEADTTDERGRGLMGVTDLGGYDGMLFTHDAPAESRFFMFQTPMPLTLTWFDGTGANLGSTDMDPCTSADSDACVRYDAPAPYLYAIEVPQGSRPLTDVRSLEVGGSCTSA